MFIKVPLRRLSIAAAVLFSLAGSAFADTHAEPLADYPWDGDGRDIAAGHHDSSPTDSGVPLYTDGKSGQALSLTGTNSYVDLTDSENWFNQQSFSIGFWLRDDSTVGAPQVDLAQLIGQYDGRHGTNFWEVDASTGANGTHLFRTNNGGADIPFSFSRGDWHYVLLVRDNLTATVYVDGIAQGSSTGTGADHFLIPDDIRVGADRDLARHYKGAIDELRLYDRALSPIEIAQLSTGDDLAVPGTSDIYLAGQSTGATSSTGDSAPDQAPASIVVQELDVLLITVTGTVGVDGGVAATGADGGDPMSRSAEHSLGGYSGPAGSLIATFLDANAPSGTAPADLDFTQNGDGLADQDGQAQLRQVFYLGGNTSQSTIVVNVPQFATRLFLGVADGSANSNNTGTFSVHIVSVKQSGLHQTTVQGVTDIFKAPAGSTGEGFTPDNSVSFPAGSGKVLTFSNVSGNVTVDSANDPGEPDGSPRGPDGGTYQAPLDVAGANGLSGLKTDKTGALVGVFLAGSGAAPDAPPAKLDFTSADLGADFTTLAPAVGQVFLIGDGLTSTGQLQKFTVPPTATNLYLGIADGSNTGDAPGGYDNNDGSIVATYRIAADSDGGTTGPTTSAVLSIAATATSTSDPTGQAPRVGDDLTYTLTWINTGDATAKNLHVSLQIPSYIDSILGTPAQFVPADLTFNSFGHYVAASSSATMDAQIVWDVSDLDPNFTQSVTLKIHLSNKVAVNRAFALPNNYSVYSTAQPLQPATPATGFSSGSPNVTTTVLGPINFTITPSANTVAPGGYLTYSVKLENLSTTASNASAVSIQLPAYTRFAGFGLNAKGVPIADPAGAVKGEYIPHGGNPGEIVLSFGKIAAHKSLTALITVQAQWIDPAEVPNQKLTTLQAVAAFINPANASAFNSLFAAADSSTDFVAFLKAPAHSTTYSLGNNGPVLTSYSGSLANAPKLSVLASLTDVDGITSDDPVLQDLGNGDSANTVEPGKAISFVFGVLNTGKSPAEDISLRMKIPEGTNLMAPNAKETDLTSPLPNQKTPAYAASLRKAIGFFGASKNARNSDIDVALDGAYLTVSGIHLDAATNGQPDVASVTFTVHVKTDGNDAPAVGQTIHGGIATALTSSDSHSYFGVPGDIMVNVTGPAVLAQLPVAPFPANPRITHDVNGTVTALNALYHKTVNAEPLVAGTHEYVAGVERFYIHYRNTTAGALQNLDIDVPLPAGSVFYRALYVEKAAATLSAPAGATITAPSQLAASGTVTYHLKRLNAHAEGDVMLEVILTDNVKQISGTGFAKPVPIMHNSSASAQLVQDAFAAAAVTPQVSVSGAAGFQRARDTDVPSLGVIKIVPRYVRQNDTFHVTFVVANYGDSPARTTLQIPIPAGTEYVSSQGGNVQQTYDSQAGRVTSVSTVAVTNGNFTDPNNPNQLLLGHSIATLNVVLRIGFPAVGTTLTETGTSFTTDYQGKMVLPDADFSVEAEDSLKPASPGNQVYHDSISMHVVENSDDASSMVIPLGGGKIALLAGVTDYSIGGGALLLVDNLNALHVVTGSESDITLKNVKSAANMTVAAFQGQLGPLLKNNAVTILNVNASNIVSPDGAGIVSNSNPGVLLAPMSALFPVNSTDVRNIVVTGGGGQLVAAGGGNLVAAGGGNLVAAGGGNMVTLGGGLVAAGGGNLVAAGGGNLVAAGGGNLVAAGGGNLVAAGGGNLVAAGGGNLVAAGGGNLVAAGGGNLVAVSGNNTAGLVAAGGGNLVAAGGGNLVAAGAATDALWPKPQSARGGVTEGRTLAGVRMRYLAKLTAGRIVLWCYLLWYLSFAKRYFDPSRNLWLTSLGLSAIIGIALVISTWRGRAQVDKWQTFRLFLMPFCVSSFAALVKGKGFVLVFSPRPAENFMALAACAVFGTVVAAAKWIRR